MSEYDCPTGVAVPGPSRQESLIHRRHALWAVAGMCGAFQSKVNANIVELQELRRWLPSAHLSGSTRFSYWGFALYDASLWVQPGFNAPQFDRFSFALQLHYLRDFTSAAISTRSVEEMARFAPSMPEQRKLWQQWLQAAFPDVQKGDRITGVHLPGNGAIFLTNGRETGKVADPEFARLFFGIWLSSRTSQPAMRRALLAGTAES